MEFTYYLVVSKKKSISNKPMFLKYELRTEKYKFVPMLEGYQNGTLFQSIHEAEFALKAVDLKRNEASFIPVKINFDGIVSNEV